MCVDRYSAKLLLKIERAEDFQILFQMTFVNILFEALYAFLKEKFPFNDLSNVEIALSCYNAF